MKPRLVNVDRETPMMLPPDLKDWVAEDDLVHFVLEAVEGMHLPELKLNRRGSGSAQYPPHMMLALLIYCYANGIFSSRKIERATWRDVSVRYLTGDTHPDHDTICAFRRNNTEAIREAFRGVLELACELEVLKLGTISIDGTQIKANASKHKNVHYERAGALERQLEEDIEELMREAEAADQSDDDEGDRLPQELARRETLRKKMSKARSDIEQRVRREEAERQEREQRNFKSRRKTEDSNRGRPRKSPDDPANAKPKGTDQINLTDGESLLMRQSRGGGWQQAYNAQAVVDADGSQLVLVSYIANSHSDRNELEPALQRMPSKLGAPRVVLADAGYANAAVIRRMQEDPDAPELYVAVTSGDNDFRRYEFRPPKKPRKTPITDPTLVAMREKVCSEQGRKIYGKRKCTAEPVFGIIKHVLGFRQFLRRGIEAVESEWTLACTAYNLKRLWALTGG